MDIATSGVADDARIADEQDVAAEVAPPSPALGDAEPVPAEDSASAALVWLAEPGEVESDTTPSSLELFGAPTGDPAGMDGPAAEPREALEAAPNHREGLIEARDLPLWIPDEPSELAHPGPAGQGTGASGEALEAGREMAVDARAEAVALRLEDAARRIRAGELRLQGTNEEPTDAGALAAVLASLLDHTR